MTEIYSSATRGSTVNFSFTFKDPAGQSVAVQSGSVRLRYFARGVLTVETITLDEDAPSGGQGSANWHGRWDSAVADAGLCQWYAVGIGGGTHSSMEGQIELKSNSANPDP